MSDRDAPRPDKEQRPGSPGQPEFDPSQAEKAAASFRPVWDTGENNDLDADWGNVPEPVGPSSTAAPRPAAATSPSDRPPSDRPSSPSDRPSGQPSPVSRSQQKTLLGLSAPAAEELRRAAEASAARAAERAVSGGQPDPEPPAAGATTNLKGPAAQKTIMGLAPVVAPKSAAAESHPPKPQPTQSQAGTAPAPGLEAPVFAAAAREAPKATALESDLAEPDSEDLEDAVALGKPSGRPWIALGGIVAALIAVGIVIYSLQGRDSDLGLDQDLSEPGVPMTKTDESSSSSSKTETPEPAEEEIAEPVAEPVVSSKPVDEPAPSNSAVPEPEMPKAPVPEARPQAPPRKPAPPRPKPPPDVRPASAPATKPVPPPTPAQPPPAAAKPKPPEGIVRETPF